MHCETLEQNLGANSTYIYHFYQELFSTVFTDSIKQIDTIEYISLPIY